MALRSGGLMLELTRVVPAAPSRVFAHFSEADLLATWWGPRGFTIPAVDFEPRVGASYRIEMQPPEGAAFHLAGEFRAVDPPARLAFTFRWEDPDPDDVETVVEVSFREAGEATEIAVSQGAFRTEARRELHRNGWGDSLDKLEEVL